MQIVAAGLLLWGTLKNKSAPVLAYLIIEALAIFSNVVVFVVLAVSGALLAGGEPEQDVKGRPYWCRSVHCNCRLNLHLPLDR